MRIAGKLNVSKATNSDSLTKWDMTKTKALHYLRGQWSVA